MKRKIYTIGLLTILSLSVLAQNQIPSPRYGATICYYNDTAVFIYGGVVQDNSKSNNTTPTNDLYQYNPATLTFKKITPSGDELPASTGGAAVVVHNGKVYFLGGYRTQGDDQMYSFDPTLKYVTQGAQQPYSQRGGMSLGNMGSNKHLLSGGQLADGTASGAVYEFDASTEVFTQKADIPQGTALHGHTTVCDTVNHKAYIFGGLNSEGHNFSCYEYNTQTNSWDFGPSIQNYPQDEWTAYSANGRTLLQDGIFLAGGQIYDPNKATNSVAFSSNLYTIELVNGNMVATLVTNTIPPMIGGVAWCSLETNNDTVYYMFGGINSITTNGDTTFTNNFYRYNQTAQLIQQYDTVQQTWGEIINSINENEFDKNINLQVYPNPATSEINLAVPINETIESIKIFNQNGQLVKQITNPDKTSVNVSDLTAGVYFIRTDTETNRYLSKMMKE